MAYDPNGQVVPEVAQKRVTALDSFKKVLEKPITQKKLEDILGSKKAAKYNSTLIQLVSNSRSLQECEPYSIMAAAVTNATLGLEIAPMFGYAAIIPFNNSVKTVDQYGKVQWHKEKVATYQIMTKGWIQLAMRSGEYNVINADAVYEDELVSKDILSGRPVLKYVEGGYRDQGDTSKVVGFFAYFRLNSGAEKVVYMDVKEIEAHARRYSKSYSNYGKKAIPKNWKPSFENKGIGWDGNWPAMAQKTVIKQLITRWGTLSTEMAEAIRTDQAAIGMNGETTYVDNMEVDEVSGEVLTDYSEAGAPAQPEAPDGEVAVPSSQEAPAQRAPVARPDDGLEDDDDLQDEGEYYDYDSNGDFGA